MKKLSLCIAPFLLLGCKAEIDDLEKYVDEVKQNTPVSIEAYPEFTTMPAFEYTAATKRSPFERPKNAALEVAKVQRANCLQPDFSRKKSPLETYGMDALTVSGVFTSVGKKWALIKANDGSLFKATTGDYLGLFFGKITSIENGKVSITEMLPDGAGCWQKKQATLTMSSQAGENDNV